MYKCNYEAHFGIFVYIRYRIHFFERNIRPGTLVTTGCFKVHRLMSPFFFSGSSYYQYHENFLCFVKLLFSQIPCLALLVYSFILVEHITQYLPEKWYMVGKSFVYLYVGKYSYFTLQIDNLDIEIQVGIHYSSEF